MKYALSALLLPPLAALATLALAADSTTATTAPAATSPATTSAPAPTSLLPLGSPSLPKTIYTEVFLREKNESIKGDLLAFDDTILTIHRPKDDRLLKWTDLTPASAFTLRARLIDKTNPQHWLALGTFAWGMGASEQARPALTKASAMNPALKPEVDALLKTKPGAFLLPPTPPEEKVAAGQPASPPEKSKPPRKEHTGELFPEVKGK